MDPIQQIMHNWTNRVQNPKKRWRTVCRNEAEGGSQAQSSQQQASLSQWIRPAAWMTTPLDLSPDVASMIVEMLMHEGAVATIRSFALVSRACAASVSSTLQSTNEALRRCAARVASAEAGLHVWCGRVAREEARQQWLDTESRYESDEERLDDRYMEHYDGVMSESECDDVDRMEALRDAFHDKMKSVGITEDRRNALVRMARVAYFHDNISLLAHLSDGCELCGATTGVRCNAMGGPVALFSCGACRHKNGVELELRPVGPMGGAHPPRPQQFVATIDACETVANDYARALLCKHKARRQRMRSNRPQMLGATSLMKRVHVIESNASLLACYDQSKWCMGYAPWEMVLWHRLPPSLPQHFTFSAMVGVRDSALVRDEALRDAERRKAVRRRGAYRRSALSRLFRTHGEARENVWTVVNQGTFEGWVQIIDLCTAAHAFESRWMFRAHQSSLNPPDWRLSAYKLLNHDQDALSASVRRVSAVATVLRMVGGAGKPWDNRVREVLLQLVRNFPLSFLEGSVTCLNGLTSMLLHAPVELSVLNVNGNGLLTLQATYTLGGPFYGKTLSIRSYFTGYTVAKALRALGEDPKKKGGLTNFHVQQLQMNANNMNFKGCPLWNAARTVVFGLPACWPSWITDEAAKATWSTCHDPNRSTRC